MQTSESCRNFAASISDTTPELTLQNVSGGELKLDDYYDEYSTPSHRNKGSAGTLWRASNIQRSEERVPVARLHQRNREHVLQGDTSLEQVGGVLRLGAGVHTYLPERHQAVLLRRTEGEPHRTEILGWLQLPHLQRAVCQGAEHPDA